MKGGRSPIGARQRESLPRRSCETAGGPRKSWSTHPPRGGEDTQRPFNQAVGENLEGAAGQGTSQGGDQRGGQDRLCGGGCSPGEDDTTPRLQGDNLCRRPSEEAAAP